MSRKKKDVIHRSVSFAKKERWADRPVYKGYIIPYTTLINDGVPNFQALDFANVLDCFQNKKCGVCGKSLLTEKWMAFIGGDKCAENFAFIDPPMHPECAYYAAETCPYLKNADGAYSKNPNLKAPEGVEMRVLEEVDKMRPDRLMILFSKDFELVQQGNTLLAVASREPHIIDWNAMPPSTVEV